MAHRIAPGFVGVVREAPLRNIATRRAHEYLAVACLLLRLLEIATVNPKP
jgi:hypothetical protein